MHNRKNTFLRRKHTAPHAHVALTRRQELGRRPRRLPPRGVGPRCYLQRARRSVAAAGGVQSGARGGEGVSGDPPSAAGVRWVLNGEWRGGCERGVGAQSSDDGVGGHACSFERTLLPRVLRGEGRPRRPGRRDST